MSLKTYTVSLAEKIEVIERLLIEAKRAVRNGDGRAQERLLILKSVAADLEARRSFPRSNVLGELGRILERVKRSKTALGYDHNQLEDLARHVISRWPAISQALEQYGEESVE